MITIKTVPPVLGVVLTILFILAATPHTVAVETSRLADFPTGYTNTGLTC
jgi:FlaG/FlaF family flagellin (archaellin)